MSFKATFASPIMFGLLTLAVFSFSTHTSYANESKETSAHAEGGKEEGHGFVIFPHKEADPELSKQPGKATLTSPTYYAKISGNTVKLEWKASEDAEQYHLQVATDPAFKWLVTNEVAVKGTSYDLNNLEAGKHYFWRVVGVRPNNKAGHTKGFWAMSMFQTTGEAK